MKHVTLNFEEDELLALDAFAEKRNLSRNGAVVHLLAEAMGGIPVPQVPLNNVRQAFAKELLKQAQKYVGVHPAKVDGDEVVKEHDPEAEEGKERFYANKQVHTQAPNFKKGGNPEDESQDPEDY